MSNNWYNGNNDWYRSEDASFNRYENYSYENTHSVPIEDEDKFRKKRRIRITALLVCIAVIALTAIAIIFFNADSGSASSPTDMLPRNWKDYMEQYYAAPESQKAQEVKIPKAKDVSPISLELAAHSSQTLSAKEIYAKCAPSIVCLTASNSKSVGAYSWGTGIIFSDDGYIITNTHIIAGCNSVKVELYNGDEYEATLVGADSLSDISILKINANGLTPAQFASSSDVAVGDDVIALGNPLGEAYRLTMTDGIISGISREVNHSGTVMNLLQTNAAINEGNSGGALINSSGQVIGITNMKITSSGGVEGIGFAIPSDSIKPIADSLFADGVVKGRATIGITIGPIPQAATDYYDIPTGLYVSVVNGKSDAFKQGIQVGDIIIKANGKDVSSNADISAIKDAIKIGDSITFTVWRDGDTKDITVKLMDAIDLS